MIKKIKNVKILLERLEDHAHKMDLKYEARLAASLFDVCSVNEMEKLLPSQIECFLESIKTLMNKWGNLDKIETDKIRSKLLNVNLTWLPVTAKAQKDIEAMRHLLEKTSNNDNQKKKISIEQYNQRFKDHKLSQKDLDITQMELFEAELCEIVDNCQKCKGTGKIKDGEGNLNHNPYGYMLYRDCPDCEGKGYIE